MNILLTGVAGFIGSHTAKALSALGHNIIGIDNFNDYYDPQIKEDRIKVFLFGLDNLRVYRGDITDKVFLDKIFSENKIDIICHLAAQAGVRYSLENPDTYIQTNILGTNNILEMARKYGVSKIVYASSSSVYGGNTKMPFSESDDVSNSLALYAVSKRTNELQARAYYNLFGINSVGLRFFTVYGPWGRPDMALFKFTKAILNNQPIDVYNNGNHKRDFTYVDDIVSGIVAALNNCSGCEIYNLGNGSPTALTDFIILIEKRLNKSAQKNFLPMQAGDVVETYADISKARNNLGFDPKTGSEAGINKFIEWYLIYHKNKT
jgi:UDP-glucuronate 4-epimerase